LGSKSGFPLPFLARGKSFLQTSIDGFVIVSRISTVSPTRALKSRLSPGQETGPTSPSVTSEAKLKSGMPRPRPSFERWPVMRFVHLPNSSFISTPSPAFGTYLIFPPSLDPCSPESPSCPGTAIFSRLAAEMARSIITTSESLDTRSESFWVILLKYATFLILLSFPIILPFLDRTGKTTDPDMYFWVPQVCGLTWRSDGQILASGGNDNVVNCWESVYVPLSAGSPFSSSIGDRKRLLCPCCPQRSDVWLLHVYRLDHWRRSSSCQRSLDKEEPHRCRQGSSTGSHLAFFGVSFFELYADCVLFSLSARGLESSYSKGYRLVSMAVQSARYRGRNKRSHHSFLVRLSNARSASTSILFIPSQADSRSSLLFLFSSPPRFSSQGPPRPAPGSPPSRPPLKSPVSSSPPTRKRFSPATASRTTTSASGPTRPSSKCGR
jgi:hypothetical protein